jgi:hypothetical protein
MRRSSLIAAFIAVITAFGAAAVSGWPKLYVLAMYGRKAEGTVIRYDGLPKGNATIRFSTSREDSIEFGVICGGFSCSEGSSVIVTYLDNYPNVHQLGDIRSQFLVASLATFVFMPFGSACLALFSFKRGEVRGWRVERTILRYLPLIMPLPILIGTAIGDAVGAKVSPLQTVSAAAFLLGAICYYLLLRKVRSLVSGVAAALFYAAGCLLEIPALWR